MNHAIDTKILTAATTTIAFSSAVTAVPERSLPIQAVVG